MQADVFSFAIVCYELVHRRLIQVGVKCEVRAVTFWSGREALPALKHCDVYQVHVHVKAGLSF